MRRGARRRRTLGYAQLPTEAAHPSAHDLERRSTQAAVELLLREEGQAHRAVLRCAAAIAEAVELTAAALASGGRLLYVGAGTSGRLGALDAAELPPTFGSPPTQVVAVLAGGPRAMLRSVEGAEDRPEKATARLERLGVGPRDVVCAIAASGVTPFARQALEVARARGARTLFVTCVPPPAEAALADVVIAPLVGPEVVAGSTRLKAGTATKMVLNALSTVTMIRRHKVYRGRMVDLVAGSRKLRDRARRIVAELGGLDDRAAQALLRRAGGSCKVALVMNALSLGREQAERLLAKADGDLHQLLGADSPAPPGAIRTRRRP